MALGCGQPAIATNFGELLKIGMMADCYGLTAVCQAVEWQAALNLTVERAVEVLASEAARGLARLRDASKEMALCRFEAFAATDGFLRLDEEELGSLLDEGRVEAEGEERVLEAVARWMRGGEGPGTPLRGEGLLRKVRFGAMGTEYLAGRGRKVLGDCALLEELVEAALASRADRKAAGLRGRRGAWELSTRRGAAAIGWGRYVGTQSVPTLKAWLGWVTSVAACHARQYWGTTYGIIMVTERDGAGLRLVKELRVGEAYNILCMATWRGLAVSGNSKGMVRVWDAERGRCLTAVQAHTEAVRALAVCGDGRWLVSGSDCCEVAGWAAGAEPGALVRDRVRAVGGAVQSIASLGGDRVAVACRRPPRVVVWNVAADTVDRTIHVYALAPAFWSIEPLQVLAVDGGRLVTSHGRRIEVWSVQDGAMLLAAEAYPADSPQRVRSLAVHAGKLITGSKTEGEPEKEFEICVRDLETLRLEHVLPQSASGNIEVTALLAGRGCVYGCIGREATFWGLGDGRAGA